MPTTEEPFEFHGWAFQGCSYLKSCGRPVSQRHRTERNPQTSSQGIPPLWETTFHIPCRRPPSWPLPISRQEHSRWASILRRPSPCPLLIEAFPAEDLLLLQNQVVYFQKMLCHSSWPLSFLFVSVGINTRDFSMAFFYPNLRTLLYTILIFLLGIRQSPFFFYCKILLQPWSYTK